MSAISDRGCIPLGSLVMKPRCCNDFPYWFNKRKQHTHPYRGNLRQTTVETSSCQTRLLRRGWARCWGNQRSGTINGADAVPWVFYTLCGTMSMVYFFVPSKLEKSLHTISCERILCIILQFSRVGYSFLLYQFLSFQTSPPHFYCLTALC